MLERYSFDNERRVILHAHGDEPRVLGTLSLRVRARIKLLLPGESDGRGWQRLALITLIDDGPHTSEFLMGRYEQARNVPEEAILYWFTGCFYGSRQDAFRKAWCALLS